MKSKEIATNTLGHFSVSASGWSQTYGYDPLLRFAATTGAGLPRSYAYDGDDMLVTNLNGQFLTRIVHGPGENEPLYQLDNQGRRYWYHADERGSIVAASDTTGAIVSIVPFDESAVLYYDGTVWVDGQINNCHGRKIMTNILSIVIILIQILLLTLDWWDGTASNFAFFYVATAVCAGAIRQRSDA